MTDLLIKNCRINKINVIYMYYVYGKDFFVRISYNLSKVSSALSVLVLSNISLISMQSYSLQVLSIYIRFINK